MSRRAPSRLLLNLGLDSLLALMALPIALLLASPGSIWPSGPWWAGALPGAVAAFWLAAVPLRLPRQYWRYSSVSDLVSLSGAALVSALLFAAGCALLGVPLSPNPAFPAIHAVTLAAALVAPRVVERLRHARGPSNGTPEQAVLLAGTPDSVDLFLRALQQSGAPGYRVQGILARRARHTGRRIQGHSILAGVEDAEAVLEGLRAEGRLPNLLVLTDEALAGPALETLMDAADRHGVPMRRAPRPTTLDTGSPQRPGTTRRIELRPIAIEELLDRPQVPLDREGMARLIQGRRVLVTGAGGTIGGELARQVAALGPSKLVLLDHGEFALYEINLELSERNPALDRQSVLADVRDAARIERLMAEFRPELVFHAAALKHVPMVENDPLEGLLTNAQGTRIVADAARRHGCRAMVFISTDKAVNPTSVMGASKRLAEMYCQGLDRQARLAGGMRCVTVRFGNVLGSTGSVVPLFRRQLERGGPLTVTHPDMRRYFMTVREAVGLVLQASVVGAEDRADQPPELKEGGIFVLDMGKPVKIVDMARRMIRLAGLRPDEDVEILFTGLRPGEKLYEELFHGQEPPRPTQYPGLMVATPRSADPGMMGAAIDEIAYAARAGQVGPALARLAGLVPEFSHNADGITPPRGDEPAAPVP